MSLGSYGGLLLIWDVMTVILSTDARLVGYHNTHLVFSQNAVLPSLPSPSDSLLTIYHPL